jgi:hypothetical protein
MDAVLNLYFELQNAASLYLDNLVPNLDNGNFFVHIKDKESFFQLKNRENSNSLAITE